MSKSNEYRFWLDNGDFEQEGRSKDHVLEDVYGELKLWNKAIVLTRADMSKAETLEALEHVRFLIERSSMK